MQRFFACFIVIAFIFLSLGANAQNLSKSENYQIDRDIWEEQLNKINKDLARLEKLDTALISEYKDILRNINITTDEYKNVFQTNLEAETTLLKALGDNPEAKESEAAEIRKQRTSLEERIAEIDTRIRTTRLIAARSTEYLNTLETWEQERLRNELFARSITLWSSDVITALLEDIERFFNDFNNTRRAVLMMLGMIFVTLGGYTVTGFLNEWFIHLETISLRRPFSRSLLSGVTLFAYITTLLRFKVTSVQDYIILSDIFSIVAATYLSVVMFLMLLRIRFTETQKDYDVMTDHEDRGDMSWLFKGALRLSQLMLLCVPFVSFIGYINLGLYLSLNIFITLFACFLFIWLRSVAVRVSHFLQIRKKSQLSEQEADEAENLSPLATAIIEPLLALMGFALIAFFWGTSAEDVEGWILQLQRGIVIGDITIDLPAIAEGIVLFLILFTTTRILQWFISSRIFPNTSMDTGLQHAILTITGYVGNIVALLLALGAIGLDMSNLAIIAGALSVGIGFGLQAVFNNFVSGLILLFERPFKVGDWIITGAHQGRIKKIRVRSTEIETFQNASVIVPNSMLISDVVANWTLHNNVGRVDIAIGVAYGSDTRQVQKILLEMAKAHDQVRSYPKPQVLFMAFGENSLNFELRCHVRNIADGLSIASDLRFAIDDAFRKHQIEIPFPQRDVHIRSAVDLHLTRKNPKTEKAEQSPVQDENYSS